MSKKNKRYIIRQKQLDDLNHQLNKNGLHLVTYNKHRNILFDRIDVVSVGDKLDREN